VVGSVGRTRVSPETWGDLELTWRQLGFWASSMIFLLAAMLVPQYLTHVTFGEVLLLGVVMVAALAARAAVLFGLLPILSGLGLAQRVAPAYGAVMLWGGLRGAVSLTLALAVSENSDIDPAIAHFVAVLAPGYVLLTLFLHHPAAVDPVAGSRPVVRGRTGHAQPGAGAVAVHRGRKGAGGGPGIPG